MLRKDIPEGSDEIWMPKVFGYGRIGNWQHVRATAQLREWYVSLKLFGHRWFVASGIYDGQRRGFRGWHQG